MAHTAAKHLSRIAGTSAAKAAPSAPSIYSKFSSGNLINNQKASGLGALTGTITDPILNLFGLKDLDYPWTRATIKLNNGVASILDVDSLDDPDGDSAGDKKAREIGNFVVARVNDILKATGKYGKPGLNTQFRVGTASGREDSKLGTGFWVGQSGDFAKGAEFINISSLQDFAKKIDTHASQRIGVDFSTLPEWGRTTLSNLPQIGEFDNTSAIAKIGVNLALAAAGGYALSTLSGGGAAAGAAGSAGGAGGVGTAGAGFGIGGVGAAGAGFGAAPIGAAASGVGAAGAGFGLGGVGGAAALSAGGIGLGTGFGSGTGANSLASGFANSFGATGGFQGLGAQGLGNAGVAGAGGSFPVALGTGGGLNSLSGAASSLFPSLSDFPGLSGAGGAGQTTTPSAPGGTSGLGSALQGLLQSGTTTAAGLINRNDISQQQDYLKSLVTRPQDNPFTQRALAASDERRTDTPIFQSLQSSVTDPSSIMGAEGPYAGLTEYYTKAEQRKAAQQGLLPGTGPGGALNQGAVDQIMASLGRNVAPLYPQTVNAYSGAYNAEQQAQSNQIRDLIAGIGPYQGPSNTAIAGLGNLTGQRVAETDTALSGLPGILDWLF